MTSSFAAFVCPSALPFRFSLPAVFPLHHPNFSEQKPRPLVRSGHRTAGQGTARARGTHAPELIGERKRTMAVRTFHPGRDETAGPGTGDPSPAGGIRRGRTRGTGGEEQREQHADEGGPLASGTGTGPASSGDPHACTVDYRRCADNAPMVPRRGPFALAQDQPMGQLCTASR